MIISAKKKNTFSNVVLDHTLGISNVWVSPTLGNVIFFLISYFFCCVVKLTNEKFVVGKKKHLLTWCRATRW
jgi:hypothetical protein